MIPIPIPPIILPPIIPRSSSPQRKRRRLSHPPLGIRAQKPLLRLLLLNALCCCWNRPGRDILKGNRAFEFLARKDNLVLPADKDAEVGPVIVIIILAAVVV